MTYLIDGYNLMHFLGLARPTGARSLEKSRLDLQDWLRNSHGKMIADVTVIFDGRVSQAKYGAVQMDRGLRVHFSQDQSADDLIAQLVKESPRPQQMTVVSSDRRIQENAKRRGCVVWSCDDYVQWTLERGAPPPRPTAPPEKPDDASPDEIERWLQEFAEVDADPELRRFNKMYEDFEKNQ